MTQNSNTVSIQIPAGMSKEQFEAMVAKMPKAMAAAELQKLKDKSVYQALTDLRDAHKDEYKTLLRKRMKTNGVPADKIPA